MPLTIPNDLPTKFPEQQFVTLDNFKRGVITVIDRSRLPKNALEEADNLFLEEDGQPGVRPGVDWFGVAAPNGAEIDGMDYFDSNGTTHLLMVAGGTVYRSLDDGATWTACTGYTLTAGIETNFNQYNNLMYITNGVDNITLYDGTTVLTQYTTLATPTAPSAAETALAGTGYKYYYKIARVNTIGFSAASPVNTGTVETNIDRSAWTAGTNYVTITTPNGVATQTRWDVYLSTDNVNFYYLGSTAATNGAASTFVDDGSGIVVPSTTAPTASTATGPKVKELTNVGSRMYGVQDSENRYRIWFSSGNTPKGAFSSAYDGGWLDWQEGGKYIPVKVADYRDGKGTPLATIWCDSADGEGCILQMSLDTVTVGDISITVPAAYKLPGSRGTPAPGSVVNVLNDYMFYNSQAFYNLGSRAQFLNLLSTDEASGNIRPTVRRITTAGESGIASAYFDANVYFSIPYGVTSNNYTAVYNTELKAWLPRAFTIGFKKFLKYTDSTGVKRLLAIKPDDTRLSEISSDINGDYGEAFVSSLVTGLYPTTRNRFEFLYVEEGELEFSQPQEAIIVQLYGIDRKNGYGLQIEKTINADVDSEGWSTYQWSTQQWSDTSQVPTLFARSSVKNYMVVQKELNAYQWRILTTSVNSKYILRTLQINGSATENGKPRPWKI